MDVLANDWRVSLPFFAGMGVAFGVMLCTYARMLTQLRRKRTRLFRQNGVYELAWTLLSVCVLVGCIALFMGVDFAGRVLRESESLTALLPLLVAIVSAALSVYVITKVFHSPPK